jgi:hypothetical protein
LCKLPQPLSCWREKLRSNLLKSRIKEDEEFHQVDSWKTCLEAWIARESGNWQTDLPWQQRYFEFNSKNKSKISENETSITNRETLMAT